tara:strand:- start:3074 stop:4057 length:984 start_codon:yes stop_codon:yes gene_type:complete
MIEIIAEIGSVHDGSFGNAINLIKEVKRAGATSVKFQMHIAEFETLKDAPNPSYFKGEKRFDYFQRTSFTFNEWKRIKAECKKYKVKFICSPFSIEAVDVLEKIGVDAYKIPSGELTNTAYLEKIKKTKKICFISSGMSNYREINRALKILNSKKNTLMQCSSIYPCPPELVGLNVFEEFKKKYNCRIGFSDHTNSISAAIAAITKGATSIEKHVTFSRKMYGSDASNAMELDKFKIFCDEIKFLEKMMNNKVNKNNLSRYNKMRKIFMKSIVAKNNLEKDTVIQLKDLSFKKPGDGILSDNYKKLIGKKLKRNIPKNSKILFRDLV